MEVVERIEQFSKPSYSVVTIGTFDGVHVGHRTILKQLISDAETSKGKSVLITFWPHPKFILKEGSKLKLLSTFTEKENLLAELGLDYLIKIPFTPEFSKLSAEDFVKQVLVDQIGTKKLFIGYDHHFGNNREGNIDFLRQLSDKHKYEVYEIPRQDIDDVGVSSTKIRKALNHREVGLANLLLGRQYSITGRVIDGQKRGREIGFPTANIEIPEDYKLLPADGAYAVKVSIDQKRWNGMLNIGFKPTVNGSTRTIEVHIFNFEQNIYDREITIEFVQSLREEMKFASVEELQKQLILDKTEASKILE